MFSLRRTLAVRYSVTMFVALVAIALWAWVGTRRLLGGEMDRGIEAALRLESAALAEGRPVAVQEGVGSADEFIDRVNRFVILRDAAGEILAANTPLATELPVDTGAVRHARLGRATWSRGSWRGHGLHSFYAPAPPETPGGASVIQVASSSQPVDHTGNQILFFMLGTVLLGTVATAFGASWLANSAVGPVSRIAEEAEAFAAGTTGQRITVHADVAEFQKLVGVLNRMLERLDRALLAERRIVRDAGHDLRTPLTAMLGEIEIALRRERTPAEYRAVLTSVLGEAEHLSRISEALITLARFDAGELTPQPEPTDLEALARDVTARCAPASGREVTVEGAPVTATIDADLIRIALTQLVENAVVHTPPGTRVRVRIPPDGAGPSIAVEDDGPGLPPDVRDHLFERFYRADEARATRGAGLGLSLVAAIMRAHGGSAHAGAAGERGLRITLRF